MQTITNQKHPGLRTQEGKVKVFLALFTALYILAAVCFVTAVLFTDLLDASSYIHLLLSIAVPVLGIALCAKLTTSFKPLVPFCIISAVIAFMGANITLASTFITFIVTVALCAYLLRERLSLLAILSAVGTIAVIYLLSGSILLGALGIVFFPVSLVLFLSFKKKRQRVASVCSMSLTLAITLITLFAAWIYTREGSLSVATLKGFFEILREELITAICSAFELATQQIGSSINVSVSDVNALIIMATTVFFNFLPAIFCITMLVVSYVIHSLYISIISPTVKDASEITNAITFNMSLPSAVLFFLALLAALILDREGLPMYAAAAQNIYTIFVPGFTLITFGFVGGFAKGKNASCFGIMLYIALFALIFFATGTALVVTSFAGAIIVIISHIKNRKNKIDR